jgi:hypothetical protein
MSGSCPTYVLDIGTHLNGIVPTDTGCNNFSDNESIALKRHWDGTVDAIVDPELLSK